MGLSQILQHGPILLLLAIISFVQNMAFTASSRSRNSGDPKYHFKIAAASNGIWFVCHILVWKQIWDSVKTNNWTLLILTGIIYVICTSAGSAVMMKIMLNRESGEKMVGATNRNKTHRAWQVPMTDEQRKLFKFADEVLTGVKPEHLCDLCFAPLSQKEIINKQSKCNRCRYALREPGMTP